MRCTLHRLIPRGYKHNREIQIRMNTSDGYACVVYMLKAKVNKPIYSIILCYFMGDSRAYKFCTLKRQWLATEQAIPQASAKFVCICVVYMCMEKRERTELWGSHALLHSDDRKGERSRVSEGKGNIQIRETFTRNILIFQRTILLWAGMLLVDTVAKNNL